MKNQSGFTLVETILAVGVTGILAYFVAMNTSLMESSATKSRVNSELGQQTLKAREVLNDPNSCMLNFQGVTRGSVTNNVHSGGTFPQLKHRIRNPLYDGISPEPEFFDSTIFTSDTWVSPGIYLKTMHLLADGDRTIMRMVYRLRDKDIGKETFEDVIINGKVNSSTNQMESCTTSVVDLTAKQLCESLQQAQWDIATFQCKFIAPAPKLKTTSVNLMPVFQSGANLTAGTTVFAGEHICNCGNCNGCYCEPNCAAGEIREKPFRKERMGIFFCIMKANCYRVNPSATAPVGQYIRP